MSRLACIIPVLGTTDGLETTLVSVLERRSDDCEVVVVLNVPYDDPYQLSGEVKFLQAPSHAGLVQCLNLGIGATRAPIIHTLACGYEVADGWLDKARIHFNDPRIAAVTPAIHAATDRTHIIAAGVGYHRGGSRIIARQAPKAVGGESLPRPDEKLVGPLLQAAFIRQAALAAFGGVIPTAVGDHLADIDLALTLRSAGWQIRIDSQCQVFAPAIEEQQSVGFTGGLHAERLFWRHWAETGRIAGLVTHPLTVTGSIASNALQAPLHALGRLIGFCQLGSVRSYRKTLAAATVDAQQAYSQSDSHLAETNRQEPSSRDGQSLRIDKPHPVGRRPETESVRGAKSTNPTRQRG